MKTDKIDVHERGRGWSEGRKAFRDAMDKERERLGMEPVATYSIETRHDMSEIADKGVYVEIFDKDDGWPIAINAGTWNTPPVVGDVISIDTKLWKVHDSVRTRPSGTYRVCVLLCPK